MKTALSVSWKKGLVAGIILVFSELINFTFTLSSLFGNLFNSSSYANGSNPIFLMIIIGLVVLFMTSSVYRNLKEKETMTPVKTLIIAFVTGFIPAIIVSILNLILGYYRVNNIDIRKYLDLMSPEVIDTYLYHKTVLGAFVQTLIACLAGSFVGVFFQVISNKTNQPRNLFVGIKNALTGEKVVKNLRKKSVKVVLIILFIAALIILPLHLSPFLLSIIVTIGIYSIMGMGLNIIVGLSGQLVFGYVAFYALGAYTLALLTAPKPLGIEMGFWPAAFLAMIIAGIGGLLIGLPTMGLRGDYLAIVTLGFAEIVRILLNSNLFADFTGGPNGIRNIAQIPQPAFIGKILGEPINNNVWFVYVTFAIIAVVVVIAYRLQYSRTGRAWESMRDDETVSQACGVSTKYYKLIAVIIGAAIAGIAGALYASRNTYTGPSEYAFMVSVNALAVIVVGGMGSIPGAFLGAFIIKGLPEMLRDLENYRMLVFGALLIVMMVIRPGGILTVKRRKLSVKPEPIDIIKEDMKK